MFEQAHAATRVVHFAGVAQSHTRSEDTEGTGKVMLYCVITLRNVSDVNSQSITNVDLRVHAGVPDASTPANFTTQVGTTGSGQNLQTPAVRYYKFCGQGSCAVTATATAPSTTAIVLAPRASAVQDSLVIRGAASFDYRVGNTFDNAAAVPTNINSMFHCSGSITVADLTVSTAGSIIGTGVAEAVANDPIQPSVRYGVNILSTATETAASVNTTIVARQDIGQGSTGNCTYDYDAGYPCSVGTTWLQTGPGPGAYGGHGDGFMPFGYTYPAGTDEGNTRYGGTAVSASTIIWPWSIGTPNVPQSITRGANVTVQAFPQTIVSVPFLINGGKPF